MPSLRISRRFRSGRAGAAVRQTAWVATWLLAMAGCRSGPPTMVRVPPDTALLPSPQLNPDLLKTLEPSNDRDWSPDQAVLAYAEFDGDRVTVHNIRHCTYYSVDDYEVAHYDKTFNFSELSSVDFIVVPFLDMPGIAHTMLSFGFADRDFVVVSVEIRKERGEKYHALKGFFRQYELMYVVADERDVLQLNAFHHLADVYVHHARATPEQVRDLFLDVMHRLNKLRDEPEFYHTLTNNCTTNIRDHINRLHPDRVPYDYRVILPGYSDRLAYELGLLETDTSFERTRQRNRVNYLVYRYRDDPDFSVKIRR